MDVKFNLSDPSRSPSFTFERLDWARELPQSTPQYPGKEGGVIKPLSIEEREIAAAHHALDALGVPAVADIDVTLEDDAETRLATHDLRLHGRIAFLAQRLGELGMPLPFEEVQVSPETGQ